MKPFRFLVCFYLLGLVLAREVAGDDQPWVFKTMLTQAQFDAEHAAWSAAPYRLRLSSLNGITLLGNIYYDAVWSDNPQGKTQYVGRGMTSSTFSFTHGLHVNQGRGLLWVSGFEGPSGPRYNAVWEDGAPTSNRTVAIGLTKAQLDAQIAENSAEGRELSDVLTFNSGPQVLHNGLWRPAGNPVFANAIRYNQTLAELEEEIASRFSNNWQLIRITGGQTLAGVVHCSVWARGFGRQNAYAQPRVVYTDINGQIENALYSGYRPQWIQQYEIQTGGGNNRYYIAHYVRNGGLPISYIERLRVAYRYHHVGISHQGRLIYAAGHKPIPGSARAHWPDLRANHRVRIGSVSKMITATAILDLVNRGLLSLDDRVLGPGSIFGNEIGWRAHQPFTAWEQQIRIRHLLTMTSGFATEPDWHPYTSNPNVLDILDQWVRDHDPISPPGTTNRYVNANTAMLGAVIERISGMSYEEYCRQRILRPAGIQDQHMTFLTGALNEHQPGEPFYIFHTSNYPPDLYSTNLHWRINNPGGGWVARPQDALMFLRRVDQLAFNKDILPEALLDQRFDTGGAVRTDGTPSSYGMATMIFGFGWGHNGQFPQAGGSTWLLQYGDAGMFLHVPVVDQGLPSTVALRQIIDDITAAGDWPEQLNLFDSINPGYDSWVQSRFPAAMRANASFRHRFTAPYVDPDQDGYANVAEFYHGLDPLSVNLSPQWFIALTADGIALEWWKRLDAFGVHAFPQRSPNLGLWTGSTAVTPQLSTRLGFERFRHTIGFNSIHRFGRLRYELD
ncbi:MAG TPA: serine hydrolase domain-containing protein [Kiritimatiellia bacterium]|nr:serine hydrolase domain-containing protein [Kiritimatiellia bacterium]HMO97533.1 serine hydrolase domain-containing protein [Kiritimatiellia bacterium]HMP91054.1 serine hydrolase domain-containing protein [Kiritimatiellia bacterium]